MTFLARLIALLGQVETRHWVALGLSALLHVAVMLGLHQEPQPLPEPVSFEITLQPPEEERLKLPRSKAAKNQQADKAKLRNLAKAKPPKAQAPRREAQTLEARLRPESQKPKDAPEVSLPSSEAVAVLAEQTPPREQAKPAQGALAATPGTPSKSVEGRGTAGADPAAASGASRPAGAGVVAGGSAASAGEAGLALAVARSMALAPGGGDLSEGGAAGANPGKGAEGTPGGEGSTAYAASGGTGGGLNVAAGKGANLNSTNQSPPLAGGEPKGLRLTASGSLASLPEFAQGKGGLASGHLALEAAAANVQDGHGRGQSLSSTAAGGASVSPLQGVAGKGAGGTTAVERPASPQPGGAPGGPAPGRLAGAALPGKSLGGPDVAPRPGDSSQATRALALAPGEPGSSPRLAVPLQMVQTGSPVPVGPAAGAPARQGGGQVDDKVATRPGGGDAVSGTSGTARLAQAGGGGMTAVVAGSGTSSRGSAGGRSAAPVVGPTTVGGGAPAGNLRAMTSIKPGEEKVVRADSRADTLDVLAPSNYCPLPIHAQPDNRPPAPSADRLELPSYVATNPSFVYPIMANVYGVEGKLIMRVQVLTDGRPGEMFLKQSSGNGILDRDAREQLSRWRFNPARKNGQAVTAWVDVPVIYRLPEGRK